MPASVKRAVLLALTFALACAHAEPAPPPLQLIDRLGVQVRQILETPRPDRTPEEAERATAGEIAALIHDTPGHASLTEADRQGRTPLMLAVSGGYPLVVKALLTDASVRGKINQPNAAGETAWMLAQFAPAMTLVACQPGTLTLERHPLLSPYLRRMTTLMKARGSVVVTIAQALENAGAEMNPEAARKGWLARCPNTAPELRKTLANGELQRTLVNDALDRQMAFNKAYQAGLTSLPQKPPQDMRFIAVGTEPLKTKDLTCARRPSPALLGALNWSGSVRFKAVIATRAGVVEAVDFTLLSDNDPNPVVLNHFRGALIRALASYQCEGDHVFEQEFQFSVE
jgi:hypothetical protein